MCWKNRNSNAAGLSVIYFGKEKAFGNCKVIKIAFLLDSVVPWGRNLDEYRCMFRLSDDDMKKRIAGFGDGPASFNFEATKQGYNINHREKYLENANI